MGTGRWRIVVSSTLSASRPRLEVRQIARGGCGYERTVEQRIDQIRATSSRVTRNIDLIDCSGAVVDAASVDWSARRGFPYRFVQRRSCNAQGLPTRSAA